MGRHIVKYKASVSRLPDGYTEVTYIGGNGTQFIDTGYKFDLTKNLIISGTCGWLNNSRGMLISAYNNNQDFGIELYTNFGLRHYAGGDIVTVFPQADEKQLLKIYPFHTEYSTSNNILTSYVGNGALGTGQIVPSARILNDTTAKLFEDSSGRFKNGLCGEIKIMNPDLKLHYVACRRNSDNVYGMYDLVSNTFKTNDGTEYFIHGDDTSLYIEHKGLVITKEGEPHELPLAYQEVEYLQSNGVQYINTNYYPSSNTNIEIKTATPSTENFPFGEYGSGRYAINLYTGYTYTAYVRYGGNSSSGILTSVPGATPIILKCASGKWYADNSLLVDYSSTTFSQSNLQLFLFANNKGGNPSSYLNGKIYYCKIDEGSAHIREFIPCYRKSDNKPGLYDLIEDVFYTNLGSGLDFTVGNVVLGIVPHAIKTREVNN